MRFIRKSILKKALAFTFFFILFNAGVYYFIYYYLKLDEIPAYILFLNNAFVVLVAYSFFIHQIHIPLLKVYKQITLLLKGKEYHRIPPTRIDEIGVITHFYNQITQNVEKIYKDLQESNRISSEFDVVGNIQNDILPKSVKGVFGLDIVAKTKAAVEVGGDSFDFIKSDKNTFMYIGDVTGHGVPAGLIMMVVNTLIHVFAKEKKLSNEILTITNRFLAARVITESLFMTALMLRWDEHLQSMYYSGAGHEHILIYRAKEKKVESIRSGGIALGMVPDVATIIKENHIPLNLDDVILLYTDGITEAKNNTGEMYSLERLTGALKKYGYRSNADNIFEKITEDFSNFVGEYIQKDDITLIVIKYTGEAASRETIQLSIAKEFLPSTKTGVNKWGWE